MTEALHRARCVLHPTREAAGRCRSCKRLYCRECVTLHEGRLQCARCLERAVAAAQSKPRGGWTTVRAGVRLAAGLVAVWLFFLVVAELLLAIPKGPPSLESELPASELPAAAPEADG